MDEVNKLGKILIVDDNEDVLFALNLLLEPYTEKIKVATIWITSLQLLLLIYPKKCSKLWKMIVKKKET